MLTIIVKYYPATDLHGSRMRASCRYGINGTKAKIVSCYTKYESGYDSDDNVILAARALVMKLPAWKGTSTCAYANLGELPNGDAVVIMRKQRMVGTEVYL